MATSLAKNDIDCVSNKLQDDLEGFNFAVSDTNDSTEDSEVDIMVRIGSQIKEISIWAGRIVSD